MTTDEAFDPDVAADIRRRFDQSPVCGFFGFEIERLSYGRITLALPVKPEFGHQPGFFQGAIMGAIADYAGSYAAYTRIPPQWERLTLDYTLKFIAPAFGERLIARGQALGPARTIVTSQVTILVRREGEEHLCATALVTTRQTPPKAR